MLKSCFKEPVNNYDFYYNGEQLNIKEELFNSANSTVYKVNSPTTIKKLNRIVKNDKSPLLPSYADSPKAILKICMMDGSTESKRDFDAEEKTLLQIPHHENIVQCFGLVTGGNITRGFLMEYCPGGNLKEYLSSLTESAFCWKRAIRIINEIITPVIHLHNLNIIHRDIKSLNYLVTTGTVKLCDFGLCRENTEYNKSTTFRKLRTTIMWAAPELYDYDIDNESDLGDFDSIAPLCTFKSDVYSVTIVIWEILNTFVNKKYSVPLNGNIYSIMNKVLSGIRPDTTNIPIQWTEILEKGWDRSPDARPTIQELNAYVNHNSECKQ